MVTVSAALFLIAMTPRWRANAALESAARDQRPTVSVVSPQPANANAALVLPGITEAIQETAIYARTNGYVRRWFVDIGAKVETGQLLADIETPELDQELNEAARAASKPQRTSNWRESRSSVGKTCSRRTSSQPRSSMRKEPDSTLAGSTSMPRRKT